ncbi:hypothetical protein ACH5RR_007282 [Cinchona calisaya]|uniref:Uncharacterized protein n=1 Tax=Cinchona calisaya TaxID=153742 RepID=A0ABD3ARD4_9GENT
MAMISSVLGSANMLDLHCWCVAEFDVLRDNWTSMNRSSRPGVVDFCCMDFGSKEWIRAILGAARLFWQLNCYCLIVLAVGFFLGVHGITSMALEIQVLMRDFIWDVGERVPVHPIPSKQLMAYFSGLCILLGS